MQPLAVDAALLRAVLSTDIKLAVGRELMVRVASVEAPGRGVLSLAGMLLEAELPEQVHAGAELRLVVRALTPERVVLAIVGERPGPEQPGRQPVPQAAPVPGPGATLPGGGRVRVTARGGGRRAVANAAAAHAQTLELRYDAPNLGALDLRFVLRAGALELSVAVAPSAHRRVHEQAGALELALSSACGRPATVQVAVRHEPVEVYA